MCFGHLFYGCSNCMLMLICHRNCHPNLVILLGYAIDGPEFCLIYEYMCNGSLMDCLACVVSQSLTIIVEAVDNAWWLFLIRMEGGPCTQRPDFQLLLAVLVRCHSCITGNPRLFIEMSKGTIHFPVVLVILHHNYKTNYFS